MTDLAAIATARARGQAAEADALVLADRLVAAKADRTRLRADLAQLPGRITTLQLAAAEAQARVAAATTARDGLAAQASAAEAGAATAEAAATAADEAVEEARQDLIDITQEDGGHPPPGVLAAARRRVFDAERKSPALMTGINGYFQMAQLRRSLTQNHGPSGVHLRRR